MKIWVLNPPFLPKFSRGQRSPAVTKSGTIYFPMWLAACVGVLEEAGHEVTFTDAPAQGHDLNTTLATGRRTQPRLVVMDTSTPSIINDLRVAERVRDQAEKFQRRALRRTELVHRSAGDEDHRAGP